MTDQEPHLITIEEKLNLLQTTRPIQPSSHPKIQRVSRVQEKFAQHYSPMFVSFGPIHHRNKKLRLGQQYKLMWAHMYLECTGQIPAILYQMIADNIRELMDLFNDDVIQGFSDEELSWMLFVDGCSLLQIITAKEIETMLNINSQHHFFVRHDVILLENQLPFPLLKLLLPNKDEAKLIDEMKNFYLDNFDLDMIQEENRDPQDSGNREHNIDISEVQRHQPIHLLDYLHSLLLQGSDVTEQTDPEDNSIADQTDPEDNSITKQTNREDNPIRCRNVGELRLAGIKVVASKSKSLKDISFKPGWFGAKLELPKIVVNDLNTPIFLNLIAYEMCPDFFNGLGISSYVVFIDSLIDYPEDVKALRQAGVLENSLGSDQDVTTLFNTINRDLVFEPSIYSDVRNKMDKHYGNKFKVWIADACHKYFNTPWSVIGFIAAFMLLILTFTQTWFTISH